MSWILPIKKTLSSSNLFSQQIKQAPSSTVSAAAQAFAQAESEGNAIAAAQAIVQACSQVGLYVSGYLATCTAYI